MTFRGPYTYRDSLEHFGAHWELDSIWLPVKEVRYKFRKDGNVENAGDESL